MSSEVTATENHEPGCCALLSCKNECGREKGRQPIGGGRVVTPSVVVVDDDDVTDGVVIESGLDPDPKQETNTKGRASIK